MASAIHTTLNTGRKPKPRKGAAGRAPARGAVIVLAAILSVGCAQGRHTFKAANLPDEYRAKTVDNPRTIDLSKLAAFAVSNELIDRGDVLDLTLVTGYSKDDATTTPIRVGDDGAANVPLVGKVQLAGLELEAAEQAIAAAGVHRGVFRNPHVTVTMKRPRVNKITVIGAVEEPGVYELQRGSSALLAALVAAGGLSDEAGTDVEIRRPGRQAPAAVPMEPREKLTGYVSPQPVAAQPSSFRINLVSAAKEGRGGYYLEDGDVVMVEKRDPQPIHVIGLVRKPGEYELPTDRELRVLDALALAGGLEIPWADSMLVIRHVPEQIEPVLIQVSIHEAKRNGRSNVRLAAGDVVSVEQTPTTVIYDVIRKFNIGLAGSVPAF